MKESKGTYIIAFLYISGLLFLIYLIFFSAHRETEEERQIREFKEDVLLNVNCEHDEIFYEIERAIEYLENGEYKEAQSTLESLRDEYEYSTY